MSASSFTEANPQDIARYPFQEMEKKWQARWEETGAYKTDVIPGKPKYYVLEMFPYPSGSIHMGHVRNYTLGDVIARFKRAQGFNVLHPMGWDAFGLPAENAAIERKVHPAKWTYANMAEMRRQLKLIGFSYDWDRELATCDPSYYKHEQKFFIDFLNKGLVYRKESVVNWDPVDHTVLANEQVVEGRGWRSGAPVERRRLSQWFLKITAYCDELLSALSTLPEWPDRVRLMQTNWIGKSKGAEIHFEIEGAPKSPSDLGTVPGTAAGAEGDGGRIPQPYNNRLTVFTTRPDTIYGMSFCAIAPDHPLAAEQAKNDPKLAEFIKECAKLGTAQEALDKAEKLGYQTDFKVLHPFRKGVSVPVYVANFVVMDYGTGALFGCPAHDARDLEFARKYNLPVFPVVAPKGVDPSSFEIGAEPFTDDGVICNSEFLNGLSVPEAKDKVCDALEKQGLGKAVTQFRLRDWGVSRQRYWGCPIPIIHCDSCGPVPVPDKDLPVTLPEDVTFDQPGNPLDRHPTWKHVPCPSCNKPARRETDTLDTFFESSWYFARFCSPQAEQPLDKRAVDYWLPVDRYIGGIEHAILHLLYARFFTRALKDCGYVSVEEPFLGQVSQGMVCHETYKSKNGEWLAPTSIERKDGKAVQRETGEPVTIGRSEKMSKSKKNTVDPESIIETYGADTARLFMLSDSPPERDLEWTTEGVDGAWRYVNRVWRLVQYWKPHLALATPGNAKGNALELKRITHATISEVTGDIEHFRYNRAVARLRELTNAMADFKPEDGIGFAVLKEAVHSLIILLNPMMPHLAHALWEEIGMKDALNDHPWPKADQALLASATVTMAVQVNGKLRATIEVPQDAPKEAIEKLALEQQAVQHAMNGQPAKKLIVVPQRVVNIVV